MGQPTGIEMIAAERQRQIEVEGWSPEHDDQHINQELARAACYYAVPPQQGGLLGADLETRLFPYSWSREWAKKHNKTRLHQLAVAGALIAAEIDRLQRAEPRP